MNLLSNIRKVINPPYSPKDLLVIFGVLAILVSIPLTVSLPLQRLSIAPQAASYTVVLQPSGPGDFFTWTKVGCTNNWQCVDESSPDEDTTYVRSVSGAADMYNLQDLNLAPGSQINSVTIWLRAEDPTANDGLNFGHNYGPGVGGFGGSCWIIPIGASYVDYKCALANNPSTGKSWTLEEVNLLQVGPYAYTNDLQVTRVWVEVAYAPPPPPPPCSNECSSDGAKQCTDGTRYKTCGNYDADSCLEWSSATACSAGKTCSGAGSCSSSPKPPSPTSYLENLQLEVSVPYLTGSLKAKVEVGGVSKEVELSGGSRGYNLDLKDSKLSLNKEYNLVVTSEKTIVRKVKFTPTSAATSLKVGDLILGDLNQDNTIDSTDQLKLVDSVTSQTPAGDVNVDQATNSFDWAILLINIGKKGD